MGHLEYSQEAQHWRERIRHIAKVVGINVMWEFHDFGHVLLKKHGDIFPKCCEMYHVCIGSSLENENYRVFFDFLHPEDSVCRFIEAVELKYGIKHDV